MLTGQENRRDFRALPSTQDQPLLELRWNRSGGKFCAPVTEIRAADPAIIRGLQCGGAVHIWGGSVALTSGRHAVPDRGYVDDCGDECVERNASGRIYRY